VLRVAASWAAVHDRLGHRAEVAGESAEAARQYRRAGEVQERWGDPEALPLAATPVGNPTDKIAVVDGCPVRQRIRRTERIGRPIFRHVR